jgi:predicted AlkP superfamily phosphohydrolase/phosphomutase
MNGARSLVVGLDGATLDVLRPLIAKGLCPTLAGLMEKGAHAPLNSTTPPMTLPSWSSFLTGCSPGQHGIFDFTHRVPGTYRLELTNATHRRVPTFNRVLSDRGFRTASVAFPTTYPPEVIDGVVISGFDSPVATSIDGRFCHPRTLFKEIKERFGGMAFADFQEMEIDAGWHAQALGALLKEIPRKESIATWLLEQERWEVFGLLFGESDTVAHHFWMFHDPESPRYRDEPALKDAICQVYQALDATLGRLIEKAQPEWVCVASDHGFGGAGDTVLYLNRFLEKHGWLHYSRDPHSPQSEGIRTGAGWLDRAKARALRHLPAKAQQQLVRALPNSVLSAVESSARYGDIDFSRTRAFSDEMNYAATIHLNVAGRDAQGVIQDRAAAIQALRTLLLTWEVEGQKVVHSVRERAVLYTGDAVELSPDLVLELNFVKGYTYTLLPSGRVPSGQLWRRIRPDEHAGGKGMGMNGTHRQHGLLVLWGQGVRAGVQVQANMADCLPTLFSLMGHPVPEWWDGRVLREALEGTPVRYKEGAAPAVTQAAPTDAKDAEEIRDRLRSLGYL